MKIIFASQNQGKVVEVKGIFSDVVTEIISLKDLDDKTDIIENGSTFEENALIKVKTIFDLYKAPVIADDSGLSVDQLLGRPGVYSARYAGKGATYRDNNEKLLRELEKFKPPYMAKFICCAVFYDGDIQLVSAGELPGEITRNPRGINGFGYDPVFIPVGSDRTLAEYSLDEKNKISHRANAFNLLKKILRDRGVL